MEIFFLNIYNKYLMHRRYRWNTDSNIVFGCHLKFLIISLLIIIEFQYEIRKEIENLTKN